MKRVFAVAFVTILTVCMLLTCLLSVRGIGASLYKAFTNSKTLPPAQFLDEMSGAVEKSVSDEFVLHDVGIDLYGGIQRILGKRIIRDESKTVVKGSDGKLYFTENIMIGDNEADASAVQNVQRVTELEEFCSRTNANLLFVMAPHKYDSKTVQLPIEGVGDYFEITDYFEKQLKTSGCCINLMRLWDEHSESYSDGFFITDHHWNIDTAFWGYQQICCQLNNCDGYDIPVQYISAENYDIQYVSNAFLGSMGVRVGSLYAGKDSISIIQPKLETNFLVEYQTKTLGSTIVKRGAFQESVLNDSLSYNMYITSDNAFIHVDNMMIENGHNVLLVKDSFGVPVAAWLSCWCDELWVVDLRYEQSGSIEDYIEKYDIDTVIVLYNPEVLMSDLFFEFTTASMGE